MGLGEGETRPAISFRYVMMWADGREKVHAIKLDAGNLDLLQTPPEPLPEWTALDFHRCPNCPLDAAASPSCPAAVGLAPVIKAFEDLASFDEVKVIITGPERFYGKKTTLQEAAGAIVGMVMVTAGCPILDRMRPLVRTHLPFPSNEEHSFRMIGMYLYAQYVRHREGRAADWDMAGLAAYYGEVEAVNRSLCKRLNAVRIRDNDVGINAVNVLNSNISLAKLALEDADVTPWIDLFKKHW